jgi:hypothetical protein
MRKKCMLVEAKGVNSHLLIELALLELEKELLPQPRMTEFQSTAPKNKLTSKDYRSIKISRKSRSKNNLTDKTTIKKSNK